MVGEKFTLAETGETLCTKRCSCHNEDRFISLVQILRDADVAYTNLETKIHSFARASCNLYKTLTQFLRITSFLILVASREFDLLWAFWNVN